MQPFPQSYPHLNLGSAHLSSPFSLVILGYFNKILGDWLGDLKIKMYFS